MEEAEIEIKVEDPVVVAEDAPLAEDIGVEVIVEGDKGEEEVPAPSIEPEVAPEVLVIGG